MKKVIIGAGPAGLYTAIKLRKAGIRDVVVYDPRAGNYTRPGHLNKNVFAKAEKGLDIDFWPQDTIGHIKDLEKGLYKEAQRLGIKIENKRFLRLHQDAQKPGVVIANDESGEEIVEADYVFDCTGTRREVVAAVNQVVSNSPLKLTTITEPPVRNHFLAYVKISKSDWNQFERDNSVIRSFPETIGALSFAQSIIKLRALGWKEFKFPRCYGMEFGKNKVCLYLHAPEHLTQENYDNWVQTVLECYTKPISYTHLSPSPKPRFLPFRSNAQALQEVSYKGKNLPTVITLGDAQIDFDYYLAHGIRDGMDRIDALFDHMEIFDNKIYYFDSAEYLQTINTLLHDHKKELIKEAQAMKQSFIDALEPAQLKFRQALLLSKNPKEQSAISEILKEIDARQSHAKACQVFTDCHNKYNQVLLSSTDIDGVIAKLDTIQTNLLKAHYGLSESFTTEHKEVEALLLHIAMSWKEVGNALFKTGKMLQSIEAYKKALEIYNLSSFSGNHILKELPIYSNLAIVYLHEKRYSEAIASAKTALFLFDSFPFEERPVSLQEKIIFNLVKALCAQAQEFLSSSKHKDARALHVQASKVMSENENKLTHQTLQSIKEIIGQLQQRLPNKPEGSDDSISYSSVGGEIPGVFGTKTIVEPKSVGQSLGNLGMFGGGSIMKDKNLLQNPPKLA
ncbi:hypothetical protein EP47_13530 [Legionella norrlandica]|uniref:FAD/NAD(P)-binding domain-containing protein n=1 Tax=Legionella norrlandica TaxID=1498499 RepID=A0A0A2SPP2_9GAMM|nr:tetratricopeptide repeat protein [Legionella norrlandica]KGP62722.1 hypothetical protein EP47_13530 [Legionella norrlandica]